MISGRFKREPFTVLEKFTLRSAVRLFNFQLMALFRYKGDKSTFIQTEVSKTREELVKLSMQFKFVQG